MRSLAFALTFVFLFGLTYAFLGLVDALPEPRGTTEVGSEVDEEPVDTETYTVENPVRIAAKDVGLNANVANPADTSIETLDAGLLKGAVRYPTSARLGEEGTVLVFGHSSYLPIVHNQAYKAFNSIQDLKKGEIISVYSEAREYRYAVTGIRLADATEDVVELPATGKHLTLVTCDSFGKKTSRFIVTADLEGVYELVN